MQRVALLTLAILLSACQASPAVLPTPPRPSAIVVLPTTVTRLIQSPIPTASPIPTTAPLPTATPEPGPTIPPSLEQYWDWMDEARMLYPYPEPIEHMWEVMLCESSGDPTLINSLYHGLFQYHPDTWAGEWNPYRDQPILDPRAQIFATAKAWQEGHQGWWGCY